MKILKKVYFPYTASYYKHIILFNRIYELSYRLKKFKIRRVSSKLNNKHWDKLNSKSWKKIGDFTMNYSYFSTRTKEYNLFSLIFIKK